MTPVRLQPAAHWSRVKHPTTEPLRSQIQVLVILQGGKGGGRLFKILSLYFPSPILCILYCLTQVHLVTCLCTSSWIISASVSGGDWGRGAGGTLFKILTLYLPSPILCILYCLTQVHLVTCLFTSSWIISASVSGRGWKT